MSALTCLQEVSPAPPVDAAAGKSQRVIRGTSSLARWRMIVVQLIYASGIMATVMFAERLLMWMIGQTKVASFGPAAFLHGELGARAGDSILAAPIAASILLLGGVLLAVELLRLARKLSDARARQSERFADAVDPSASSWQ